MISFFKSHSYLSSLVCFFFLLLFFGLLSLFETYQANEAYKENLMKNKEICSKEESEVPEFLCELILEEDEEMLLGNVVLETFSFQYSYFCYLLPIFIFIPIMVSLKKESKFSKKLFFSIFLYPIVFSIMFGGCFLITKDFSGINPIGYFLFGNFVSILYGFFYLFLGGILFLKFKNLGITLLISYILLFIIEFLLKRMSLFFFPSSMFSFWTIGAYSEMIGLILLIIISCLCFFYISKKEKF